MRNLEPDLPRSNKSFLATLNVQFVRLVLCKSVVVELHVEFAFIIKILGSTVLSTYFKSISIILTDPFAGLWFK